MPTLVLAPMYVCVCHTQDVKFGSANVPAMMFIGGGATSFQQWLDFLGLAKDKRYVHYCMLPYAMIQYVPIQYNTHTTQRESSRCTTRTDSLGHPLHPCICGYVCVCVLRFPPIGSPFQINFPPAATAPPEITPLNTTTQDMASCGDLAFLCSCSDCPAAPGCDAADAGDDDNTGDTGRNGCHVGVITCWDFALIWAYLAAVAAVVAGHMWRVRWRAQWRARGAGGPRKGKAGVAEKPGGAIMQPLLPGKSIDTHAHTHTHTHTQSSSYATGELARAQLLRALRASTRC